MFMGNMTSMQSLDKGKLTQKERKRRTKVETSRAMTFISTVSSPRGQYVDKDGKRRFQGKKKELKQTQLLGFITGNSTSAPVGHTRLDLATQSTMFCLINSAVQPTGLFEYPSK